MNTCDKRQQWTTSDCYDQEWPELVVQNMTFEDGNSTVSQSKGTSFVEEEEAPSSTWAAN
jgi:hypothetical protein